MNTDKVIVIKNVSQKIEIKGNSEKLHILRDISFEAEKGEFISIIGASGSGKTSLLHSISGLSKPTSGNVEVLGINPYQLSAAKIAEFRRTKVGFIFQSYNLLPALPIFENIVLPLRLSGKAIDKDAVVSLLEKLQFTGELNSSIDVLSGGEQQKIAIARVLVTNCDVVFADEPTGALDSKSEKVVFDLLRYLADQGVCVVMVTHDIELASKTDRVMIMNDGQLTKSLTKPSAKDLFVAINEEKMCPHG